jgi:hypothetical protein
MQEFILFEPFLILSKDARSPGPCAGLAPATRPHRGVANGEVVLRSAPKGRPLRADVAQALLGGGGPGDGGEVLGDSPLILRLSTISSRQKSHTAAEILLDRGSDQKRPRFAMDHFSGPCFVPGASFSACARTMLTSKEIRET